MGPTGRPEMPGLIDRYLLRPLVGRFAAIVGIIVFLLSLETMPRLFEEMRGVKNGAPLVFRSLASLAPEYVGIAIPFALFLATALTFRSLAMRGELDVLAATGLSNWRLLRQPLLLGASCCLLVIALRGYLQPAGERELYRIGDSVAAGDFGFGLEPAVSHSLGRGTRLFFARVDPSGQTIQDVALEAGGYTFLASSARLQPTRSGLLVSLDHGDVIPPLDPASPRHFRFAHFTTAIPFDPSIPQRPVSIRDRLDQIDLDQLLGSGPRVSAQAARAAALSRLSAAMLCLLLPVLGLVFGVPAKRSRSALGLGAGVLLILLFIRLSALVQDHFAAAAVWLDVALVGGFALASAALALVQQREGAGIVEQRLEGAVRKLARALFRVAIIARTLASTRSHRAAGNGRLPQSGLRPANNRSGYG